MFDRSAAIRRLNERFFEMLPITPYITLTAQIPETLGDPPNYFFEELGILWVHLKSFMLPGCIVRLHIPDNELEMTEENLLSIGDRIGGAASLIDRHIRN